MNQKGLHDRERRFLVAESLQRESELRLTLPAIHPDPVLARLPLEKVDGGPVHIHAAEQVKEVEDCLAWSGRRPGVWLFWPS